jgi:serine/threonine protein kinase
VPEDRYEILDQLGRGNFGAVFLARHTGLDRECALKLIPGDDAALAEARNLAALPEHEHVVRVLDAGRWDERTVFIASDLCMGGSLADQMGNHPLDPATACSLVSDTCRGLEHLHQHGLLHLDIRPANILLTDDRPRLADFGLARWSHDAAVVDWYGPHAAPELVETGNATTASDIYSMGMTLMHLLTGGHGCRPFPVRTELVQASADGEWPRLDELTPNVPRRVRKVIEAATQYDPDRRPQAVAEFKRQLDRATPTVSLMMVSDDEMRSTDGVWQISSDAGAGDRTAVEVRKNGRRVNARGATGLTSRQARRKVEEAVGQLARGE